jgi:hypothetical protein
MGLDEQLHDVWKTDRAVAADHEYLIAEGVVHDTPGTLREVSDSILEALFEGTSARSIDDSDFDPDALLFKKLASGGRHPSHGMRAHDLLPEGGEILAATAEQLHGLPSVAIFERPMSDQQWASLERYFSITTLRALRGRLKQTEEEILDLVIGRLPTIADDVPLEDVLSFSRDPETRERVTALRLWIARSAFADTTLRERALELDEMLHEFRRHMKAHRLKTREGAIRTLISVPLAVIEDLLHGKPASAFNAVSWTSRKAARLEAELAAPGHEVAFIESVWDRFP